MYPTPYDRGRAMESYACEILTGLGLKLLDKNYRAKCGEIDLIMNDNKCIVFIEVRYRHQERYGSSLDTITVQKQRKISRAAQFYLQNKDLIDKVPVRFDVFAITGATPPRWTWIKHAIDIIE